MSAPITGFAVLTEPCPHCDGSGHRNIVSGDALRAHRKALGRSLRYTGMLAGGLTATYLHDVEHGRRRATDRVVAAYAALTPAGAAP